ncbi:MAG: TIGR03032 family protein [Flavobacteriales bacterium]|nr:TIGR03032 family protein [Flavobacteriales bacterium]
MIRIEQAHLSRSDMDAQRQKLAPFSCAYSPQIPEILMKLGCSIAISTYQAGKIVFISPKDEYSLVQLPRTFEKPMGIAISEETDQLALACKDEVVVFTNSEDLAEFYPRSPKKYDSLYMPRVTYHTNNLDVHDLSFGLNQELFGVNTLFSCLVSFDSQYNFKPYWKPSFVSKLSSEDRCHLNGMVMVNGFPKYVTAFNQGDTPRSWRENVTQNGILMDIETNEIIASDLSMPHSPRLIDGKLYLLESAKGRLVNVDLSTGKAEEVVKLGGFLRGMGVYGDYVFIGRSKLRKNSSSFAHLQIPEEHNTCGIFLVHLPSGSLVGKMEYQMSVDEIYEVAVLSNKLRPNILSKSMPESKMGLSIPETTYWAKMKESQ